LTGIYPEQQEDRAGFRIVSQHELITKNLKERLGRLPTPLSSPLTLPHGVARVIMSPLEADFLLESDEAREVYSVLPGGLLKANDDNGQGKIYQRFHK
jgi:hypothetical protein